MTRDEKKRTLIEHRMNQAKESLDEAGYLLTGSKSLRSVTNRLYYAMFYAALALLVDEPYASSKHSGIISYFNRRFVKGGLFSEELGLAFNRAFEMRQRGDYKEEVVLDRDQVEGLLILAGSFVDRTTEVLNLPIRPS